MPSNFLSSELVDDSSDDSSSESEPTQTLKQRANEFSAKTSQSGEPQETQSESEISSGESRSSAKNEEDSVSSPSSLSKRKASSMSNGDLQNPNKKARTNVTKIKRIVATTYVPPPGYLLTNAAAPDFSSKTNGIFENLEQKQVWHINAPSSMPISALENLDTLDALRKDMTLKHGDDFYVISDADFEKPTLMLPRGMQGEYVSSEIPISHSICISEPLKPPRRREDGNRDDNIDISILRSENFCAIQGGERRPARKQPDNLKNRNVPFGVQNSHVAEIDRSVASEVNGTIDRDSIDMSKASQAAVLRTPTSSKKTKKRSSKVDVDDNNTPSFPSSAASKFKHTDKSPSVDKSRKEKSVKKKMVSG